MLRLKLEKTKTAKGFIYSATTPEGVTYKSSPTYRDYCAMFLSLQDKYKRGEIVGEKLHCENRFGRIDLIGKADSKRFIDSNHSSIKVKYVAYTEDVTKTHVLPY